MFLQHDSGIEDENCVPVFASAQGLRELVCCKSWGFDGTFKCFPKKTAQLFSGQDGTFCVSQVFALHPSKIDETYTPVFSILKDLKLKLNPQDVMMDFEMASNNAFIASFGYALFMTFCLIHLSQNIYKNVVNCTERQRHHPEDDYALKIRCFTVLAFFPVQVVAGFEELVDDLPQQFIDYFVANYIGSEKGRG